MVIMWTPGHCGIQGNVLADAVAKRAAVGVPEFICAPYTDWYPIILEHINKEWEEKWNECRQFLYKSKPAIGPHKKRCKFRRDEIVLNRLRFGHTRVTHSFLFDREIQRPRPLCRWCKDAPVTLQHVILECPELDAVRTDVFGRLPTSIASVLNVAKNPTPILNFMKEIDIYDEICNMKVYILVILLSSKCIPT